jgi:hypothetical protein
MLTISLYKTDKFEEDFFINYSKFKHGSKTQARIFGKEVADKCNFNANENLIFYSAPYNNIHTASNAFKDYLLSFCSKQFMEKNISVKQGKINREYSYDDDYGLMNKEQRAKAISSDMFHIDKSSIGKDDTLVFIDDIKITGSHETRIKELLVRQKIKNKVIFIYIAQYTGKDAQVEHLLNHKQVNNLKDVNNIIRNEEFIFNTRVVKFILKSDILDFVSFITYQSNSFKETLFSLSILNNYQSNPKYRDNFDILKNLIH